LTTLLSLGAFFLFIILILANARRNKRTKSIEGLVYLCTTSFLDARVILPPK